MKFALFLVSVLPWPFRKRNGDDAVTLPPELAHDVGVYLRCPSAMGSQADQD